MHTLSGLHPDQAIAATLDPTEFLGMAPFLRMSIAGEEFTQFAQDLIVQVQQHPDNAILWMNLATVMQCLEDTETALEIQRQALSMQRVYTYPAKQQPAKLRLLMLMVPGELSVNVPLDCLLENSDIELIYYFITSQMPFEAPIPEHDLLMTGISATTENQALLHELEKITSQWPVPVINSPEHVQKSERLAASALLQNKPGLTIAQAHPVTREALSLVVSEQANLPGCDFPVILRPAGSHGGHGLEKITHRDELASYLERVQVNSYFLSRFIDYSNEDGQFRKYRLSLIDGVAYGCHMAISSNWMVHYVNASMYQDPQKRAEEARFFNEFAQFSARHQQALQAIYETTQLDYLGIDCGETPEGDLLVFEIDPAMVVHAMDSEEMFPHKQIHMNKVKNACRDLLLSRAFAHQNQADDGL
ncbi:hypothetical protein ABC733_00350 [Mangrovibacter sp. SLW1]